MKNFKKNPSYPFLSNSVKYDSISEMSYSTKSFIILSLLILIFDFKSIERFSREPSRNQTASSMPPSYF